MLYKVKRERTDYMENGKKKMYCNGRGAAEMPGVSTGVYAYKIIRGE